MLQQERLGYRASDRLLIINADDFGMCRTFNASAQQLLLGRAINSASLMVPCPYAREAASFCREHPEIDVGIHLTFTSEWPKYKWGPVTPSLATSSLTTADGWFHADSVSFERYADIDEVRLEISSQIDRAMEWGVRPTHLDIDMYSLLGLETGRDLHVPVLDACVRYGLPLRLARAYAARRAFSPAQRKLMQRWIEAAEERQVAILDDSGGLDFFHPVGETYEAVRDDMERLLRHLVPGISEVLIHAGSPTDELRSLMPRDFPKREMEARLFLDEHVSKVLADEDIKLIRWRDLRDLQRREASSAAPDAAG
jgi:predicted glycoside hydrolase/deacetylase ChbG (UPF0249 family)